MARCAQVSAPHLQGALIHRLAVRMRWFETAVTCVATCLWDEAWYGDVIEVLGVVAMSDCDGNGDDAIVRVTSEPPGP